MNTTLHLANHIAPEAVNVAQGDIAGFVLALITLTITHFLTI